MQFGFRRRVDPRIDRGANPHTGRDNFEGGRGGPQSSIGTLCGELCKTAEPIEMSFGL